MIIHWQRFEGDDDDAAIAVRSICPNCPALSPRELWRDQRLMKRWQAPAAGLTG